MDLRKLLQITGFQWDQGNLEKNWLKHGVSPLECEQVFFNQPLVVLHKRMCPRDFKIVI